MPKQKHSNALLIEAYLDHIESIGRSPITVYNYRASLARFLTWLEDRHVSTVRTSDVREFLQRPRDRRSGSRSAGTVATPATLKRELATLRGFYRFGASVPGGGITLDPTALIETPRVRNRHPKAIPPDVWQAVWPHESLTDDELVMLGLGFWCGFRREEMVRLRRVHVDWHQLRFVGFPRKGGGDDVFQFGSAVAAWSALHPDLLGPPERFLGALERLCARSGDGPAVLAWGDGEQLSSFVRHRTEPGCVSPEVVNKKLYRLLARLGCPRAFTPHALRHSFVTYLLRGGVPLHEVSALANHAEIGTTMRYVKQAQDPLARFHSGLQWRPKWRTEDLSPANFRAVLTADQGEIL